MTEAELQTQVADYLRLQYPGVLFHSDYGSGVKLTIGQARRQKRQNGGRRAWPDMFIAEPKYCKGWVKIVKKLNAKPEDFEGVPKFELKEKKYGLFLELKRQGTRIYKKDGTLVADQHIREQYDMLEQLRRRGYKAEFACGFDEAKKIIDEYLAK